MTFGIFRNSREKQHRREIQNVQRKEMGLAKDKVMPFSYGLGELGLSGDDKKKALDGFADNWFKSPEEYLNFKKYNKDRSFPIISKRQNRNENCYDFTSYVDSRDTAKFHESKQPFYGRGERIAFIIVPHWNAFFHKYKLGTMIIRRNFLPVATYRYFPKFITENEFKDKARYDIIGPNIGLTIKRFWQDILNIQYFAWHLKNKLHYDKVGIWAYSIGSPRAMLVSIFYPDLVDYLIMNFLADSFPTALLHGISTQKIAKELSKNVSEEEINNYWSFLSPNHYEKYYYKLPKHTRLVQGKYDLIFGEENCRAMVERMKRRASFVEIEYGKFSHSTLGEFEKVIPVVWRNSRFVLRNSKLHFGL